MEDQKTSLIDWFTIGLNMSKQESGKIAQAAHGLDTQKTFTNKIDMIVMFEYMFSKYCIGKLGKCISTSQ